MGLLASGVSRTSFGRSLALHIVEAIRRFLKTADGASPPPSADQVAALWALPPEEWGGTVAPGLLRILAAHVPGFAPWYAAHASLERARDARATARGERVAETDRQLFMALLEAYSGESGNAAGGAVARFIPDLREMSELSTPMVHATSLLEDMQAALDGVPGGDALRSRVVGRRDVLHDRRAERSASYDAAYHDGEVAKAQKNAEFHSASQMCVSTTPWLCGLLNAAQSAQSAQSSGAEAAPWGDLNAVRWAIRVLHAMSALPGPPLMEANPGRREGEGPGADASAGACDTAGLFAPSTHVERAAERAAERVSGGVFSGAGVQGIPGPVKAFARGARGPMAEPQAPALFPGASAGLIRPPDPLGFMVQAGGVPIGSPPSPTETATSPAADDTTAESIADIVSPEAAILEHVIAGAAQANELFAKHPVAYAIYLRALASVLEMLPRMPSLLPDKEGIKAAIQALLPDTRINFETLVIENLDQVDKPVSRIPEFDPVFVRDKNDPETKVVDMFLHIGRVGKTYPPEARVLMDGVELPSPDPKRTFAQVLVDLARARDYGALHQDRLVRQLAKDKDLHKNFIISLTTTLVEEAYVKGLISSETRRELRIGLMPGSRAARLSSYRIRYFGRYEALNVISWVGYDGSIIVFAPNDPEAPLREYASLSRFIADTATRIQSPAYQRQLAMHVEPHHRAAFLEDLRGVTKPTASALVTAESASLNYNAAFTLALEDASSDGVLADALVELYRRAAMTQARTEFPSLKDQREEIARQVRANALEMLEDVGLNVLLIASGPLGVGYQLLDGIFTGWDAWAHGDKIRAINLLVECVFNVGAAAAGEAWESLGPGNKDFLGDFEKVQLPNSEMRLWRPDLSTYESNPDILAGATSGPHHTFKLGDASYIRMDGKVYEVTHENGGWALLHAIDRDQYRPKVALDAEGVWHRVTEKVEKWDRISLLRQASDRAQGMSNEQLGRILDTADVSANVLVQIQSGMSPPHTLERELALGEFWNGLMTVATSPERWPEAEPEMKYAALARMQPAGGSKVVVRNERGYPRVFGAADAAVSVELPQEAEPVSVLMERLPPGSSIDPETLGRNIRDRMSEAVRKDPGAVLDEAWPAFQESQSRALEKALMKRFPRLTREAASVVLEGASPGEIQSFLDHDPSPVDHDPSPVRRAAHDESLVVVVAETRRHIFHRDPRTVGSLRAWRTGLRRAFPAVGEMTSRIDIEVTDGMVSVGPDDATDIKTIRRQADGSYIATDARGQVLNPSGKDFYSAFMHAAPEHDRTVVFGTLNTREGPQMAERVEAVIREDATIVAHEVEASQDEFEIECGPGRGRRAGPWVHCAVHGTIDPAQRTAARLDALDALRTAKAQLEALKPAKAAAGVVQSELKGAREEPLRKVKLKEAKKHKLPTGLKAQERAAGAAKNEAELRLQRNYVVVTQIGSAQAAAARDVVAPISIRRDDTPVEIRGDTVIVNSGKDPIKSYYLSAKDRASALPRDSLRPLEIAPYEYPQATRRDDTEAVFLDDLSARIHQYMDDAHKAGRPIRNMNVVGQFYMYSELIPCESCTGRIEHFRKEFPNVDIEIGYSFDTPDERKAFMDRYLALPEAERDAKRPFLTLTPVTPFQPAALQLHPETMRRKTAVWEAEKASHGASNGNTG